MSRVDPAAKFYLREDLFWLSGRQNNTEEFDHAEQGRLMAALFNLEGEVYREVGNRRTIRFVSPPAETLVEHSKLCQNSRRCRLAGNTQKLVDAEATGDWCRQRDTRLFASAIHGHTCTHRRSIWRTPLQPCTQGVLRDL